jgi:hypothetical protein
VTGKGSDPTHPNAARPHILVFGTMASKPNIQAFLAGSALTASLIYLYQKAQSSSSNTSTTNDATRNANPSSRRNIADNSSQLMDSASLDQRMIRKAEGAIRNRTSRLVIVVERCTNDHNYVRVSTLL